MDQETVPYGVQAKQRSLVAEALHNKVSFSCIAGPFLETGAHSHYIFKLFLKKKKQIELAACALEPGVRAAPANVLHSRAEINRSSKSFRMLKG